MKLNIIRRKPFTRAVVLQDGKVRPTTPFLVWQTLKSGEGEVLLTAEDGTTLVIGRKGGEIVASLSLEGDRASLSDIFLNLLRQLLR